MFSPAVSIPHQLIADYEPGLQVAGFSRLLTAGALPLARKSAPPRVHRQSCRFVNLPVVDIASQANFVDLMPGLSWALCIDTTTGAPPWVEGLISSHSSLAIFIQVRPSERRSESLGNKRLPASHRPVSAFSCTGGCRLDLERVRMLLAASWLRNLDNTGIPDE